MERKAKLKIVSALLYMLAASFSHAQDATYPSRTVSIIVPTSAGSASDVAMRNIAEVLREKWGQSIVIDNRPGAGGAIGAEHAFNSSPDGHTLLFGISSIVVNSLLDENMRYTLHEDFRPISRIAVTQQILVVPSETGVIEPADLPAVLSENPDLANFGSQGNVYFNRIVWSQSIEGSGPRCA